MKFGQLIKYTQGKINIFKKYAGIEGGKLVPELLFVFLKNFKVKTSGLLLDFTIFQYLALEFSIQ